MLMMKVPRASMAEPFSVKEQPPSEIDATIQVFDLNSMVATATTNYDDAGNQ